MAVWYSASCCLTALSISLPTSCDVSTVSAAGTLRAKVAPTPALFLTLAKLCLICSRDISWYSGRRSRAEEGTWVGIGPEVNQG